MSAPTPNDRLRADVGATLASLPDAKADDIFVEAADLYADPTAQQAAARVIALQRMLADAAHLTDYTQNESSENQSDIFKNLLELLKLWQDRLDKATLAAPGGTGGGTAVFEVYGGNRAQGAPGAGERSRFPYLVG